MVSSCPRLLVAPTFLQLARTSRCTELGVGREPTFRSRLADELFNFGQEQPARTWKNWCQRQPSRTCWWHRSTLTTCENLWLWASRINSQEDTETMRRTFDISLWSSLGHVWQAYQFLGTPIYGLPNSWIHDTLSKRCNHKIDRFPSEHYTSCFFAYPNCDSLILKNSERLILLLLAPIFFLAVGPAGLGRRRFSESWEAQPAWG